VVSESGLTVEPW